MHRRHPLGLGAVALTLVGTLTVGCGGKSDPAPHPTPATTLTAMSPSSGWEGDKVTFTGQSFTGATALSFNGIPATDLKVESDTTATATVPHGATSGAVKITSPAGSATSTQSFQVRSVTLATVAPAAGWEGDTVTLTGTGLTGAIAVSFNGVAATTFSVASDTQVSAVVPKGATTGAVSIQTPHGTVTSTTSFQVGRVAIASLSATAGWEGDTVTLTGIGFTGTTAVAFGGIPATTFSVDSDTQITAVVPVGATTGSVSIQTPHGSAASTDAFQVAHVAITSLSATAGWEGETITLTGIGFTGTSSVKFNGKEATSFSFVSDTQVKAVVPTGATTGPVTLQAPHGVATSASFQLRQVTFTDIKPTTGWIGDTITLTGTGFTGTSTVSFNGVLAVAPVVNSDTQITTIVPAGATSGKVTVTTTHGSVLSPADFQVKHTAITSLTPATGWVGDTITLTGIGFTGATAVKFNGVATTTYAVVSDTQVTVVVPVGATSGFVSIEGPRGNATSTTSFQLKQVAITSLAPTTGSVGDTVTLTGIGFTGATSVQFNGKAATSFKVDSDSQISAVVPVGATTGTVSIQTPHGTATSTVSFQVVPVNHVTITSLAPTTGWVGDTVTLTGIGFTGATAVKFNGVAATTFTFVSDTQVTAVVPVGATTGPVTIQTPNGSAVSASFVVSRRLTIETMTPPLGWYGQTVKLIGSGFTGTSEVKFNGLAASTFHVVSDTQITATVPNAATSGPVAIQTPHGPASSPFDFTVSQAAPWIQSFSPLSGIPGDTLHLTGSYLDSVMSVTIGGVPTTVFTAPDSQSLDVIVPPTAVTGRIVLTSASGAVTSDTDFHVMNGQLLLNPDFEQGFTAWQGTTGAVTDAFQNNYTTKPHSGHFFGHLAGETGTQTLFQTVTIPANVTDAQLTAWVALQTLESGPADVLNLKIMDGTGNFKSVLKTWDSASTSSDWTAFHFDFSAYAGQTIQVLFESIQTDSTANVADGSTWWIDDVTLKVSFPANALPPAVSAFAPVSGFPETTWVTLTGTNLIGTNGVQFNGVAATQIQQVDLSTVRALVPASATSGHVTVNTTHGQAVSAGTFSVSTPIANLLINGDFEQPGVGWDQNIATQAETRRLVPTPHSGQRYGYLGYYGSTTEDWTAQVVTIPAGVKATLTYWLIMGTFEDSGRDTFEVRIEDPNTDTVLGTEQVVTSLNGPLSWTQYSLDLSKYAGKQVRIRFTSLEVSTLVTYWFVDDASLFVTGDASAIVPTTSTMTPAYGFPGETFVTLTGNYLFGVKSVSFNGTPSTNVVNGPTGLVVQVPVGATSGPITITTDHGTATTPSFEVAVPVANLIINGDMETGAQAWTPADYVYNTRTYTNPPSAKAHSGLYYGYLGGYGKDAVDTMDQPVELPATASRVTLTYWLNSISDETTPRDSFQIQVLDAAGITLLGTAQTITCTNGPRNWAYQLADLTPWKGKKVILRFASVEVGNLQSSWVFDDVKVYVEGATAAIPPTFTTITPSSGIEGQTVVHIKGTKLYDTTKVSFNGVDSLDWGLIGADELLATVPVGAITGPVTVTTSHGQVTTTAFTVMPGMQDLLVDGGFEAGSPKWVAPKGTLISYDLTKNYVNQVQPRHGMGEAGLGKTATLAQTVTIPSNNTGARFSFWMAVDSNQTDESTATLTVVLRDGSGNILPNGTLLQVNGDCTKNGIQDRTWLPYDYDLSAFAGQTVTISMEANTTNLMYYFDDAKLYLTGATNPAINGISPTSAVPGQTYVTLTGSNFIGRPQITFNGIASSDVKVQDANHVVALVPTGASVGGPITLTSGTTTVTSPQSLQKLLDGNLVTNSSFEAGSLGWQPAWNSYNSSYFSVTKMPPARSGLWESWLGGAGQEKVDFLAQEIQIPSTVLNPELRFWLQVITHDTTGVDLFKVRVLDPVTHELLPGGELMSMKCTDGPSQWTLFSLDMTPFKGRLVRLSMESQEHKSTWTLNGEDTSWFIDDLEMVYTGTGPSTLPSIQTITPASGIPGETVLNILGSNFLGATAVLINGVPATSWTVAGPSLITVNVPATATSGSIAVQTPSGLLTSPVSYTATEHQPAATNLLPSRGPVGTEITLKGQYLDRTVQILLGNLAVPFIVDSPNLIRIPVPVGATTGAVQLFSRTGHVNAGIFTVDPAASHIATFLDEVIITQGTQNPQGDVPMVQNRSALLCAVVRANGPNTFTPQVKFTLKNGTGTVLLEQTVNAPSPTVPENVDFADVNATWNLRVPANLIQADTTLLVTLDPTNSISAVDPGHRTWPADGQPKALTPVDTKTFHVYFIPLQYVHAGTTWTGRLGTTDRTLADYTVALTRVWPLPEAIDAEAQDPFITSIDPNPNYDGWYPALEELMAKRLKEQHLDHYYYGIYRSWNGDGGGGSGMAMLAEPVAMGVDWTNTSTGSKLNWLAGTVNHELGHSLSRQHSPCGNPLPGGPDPDYPYSDGTIGVPGYDLWATGNEPKTYAANTGDTMAYCGFNWASDYSYKKVLAYRTNGQDPTTVNGGIGGVIGSANSTSATGAQGSTDQKQDCLLVWGRLINGVMTLNPGFVIQAVPTAPDKNGTYQTEVLNAAGAVMGQMTFEPKATCEGEGQPMGFAMAVPINTAKAMTFGASTTGTTEAPAVSGIRVSRNGEQLATREVHSPALAAKKLALAGSNATNILAAARALTVAEGTVRFTWDATLYPMAMIRNDKGQVIAFAKGGSIDLSTKSRRLDVDFSDGTTSTMLAIDVQ